MQYRTRESAKRPTRCAQCNLICDLARTTSGWKPPFTCIYTPGTEDKLYESTCLRCLWISPKHPECKKHKLCHKIRDEAWEIHLQPFGCGWWIRWIKKNLEGDNGGEYEWGDISEERERYVSERFLSTPEPTERDGEPSMAGESGRVSESVYTVEDSDGTIGMGDGEHWINID